MAELELYWFSLAVPPALAPEWQGWLSREEQARAARYSLPLHRERFLAARAQLRWILAQRVGCRPGEVSMTLGPQGKPELAPHQHVCHFNLSHSGDLALVGVHSDSELGVDIERDRPQTDGMGLARRFFTPRETAWLAALAPEERVAGFGRLWTCKEAWMKSDGRGLTLPLQQVEVSFAEGGAALNAVATPRRSWWVEELRIAPEYRAAVVMASAPQSSRLRHLPPPTPGPSANAPAPAQSAP